MEDHSTMTGGTPAIGGIVLSILGIHWQDLLQATVLAIVGTAVSFLMSWLLKKLSKKKS